MERVEYMSGPIPNKGMAEMKADGSLAAQTSILVQLRHVVHA